MEENLADQYYNLLQDAEHPAKILSEFFCRLFDVTPSVKHLIIFRKLLKLYGRYNIFNSILDIYDMDNVRLENPYPLIVYFIKKRLDSKGKEEVVYLSTKEREMELKRLKKAKLDLGSPFDE